MGSRYEVEVTVVSAKDLKNVNWRRGAVKAYAVVWVDPSSKCSTRVDERGDTSPSWDEILVIPFNSPIEESTLHVDIVHAGAADDEAKPLIGSARLKLRDVVDEDGIGSLANRKLDLKRPSGRPQGKLELRLRVRETRHSAPEPYYAPPYGVHAPPQPYGVPAPPQPYGYPSYAPPAVGAYAPPPTGYPPAPAYGIPAYGQAAPYGQQQEYGQAAGYGQGGYGQGQYGEKPKSKFGGMGTGLAVGAVAGVLGGLALAEGAEYVEDKIADDVAQKVEDDLAYDDGGDDW